MTHCDGADDKESLILQNQGGWGQGPFEHCVKETSVLVEDGFPY